METYTFWYETKWGYFHEETGLTKRKAVIRNNRLQKNYNPNIKACGWELERAPICLNSLLEHTPNL